MNYEIYDQIENIFRLGKEEFDKVCYSYFKALDLNNDGYISKDEFTVSFMVKPIDRMPLWKQWPAAYEEFKYHYVSFCLAFQYISDTITSMTLSFISLELH